MRPQDSQKRVPRGLHGIDGKGLSWKSLPDGVDKAQLWKSNFNRSQVWHHAGNPCSHEVAIFHQGTTWLEDLGALACIETSFIISTYGTTSADLCQRSRLNLT